MCIYVITLLPLKKRSFALGIISVTNTHLNFLFLRHTLVWNESFYPEIFFPINTYQQIVACKRQSVLQSQVQNTKLVAKQPTLAISQPHGAIQDERRANSIIPATFNIFGPWSIATIRRELHSTKLVIDVRMFIFFYTQRDADRTCSVWGWHVLLFYAQ